MSASPVDVRRAPAPGGPARGRDLVIVRAGAAGIVRRWLEPAHARDFDLWVSWFETAEPLGEAASTPRSAVREELRPGPNIAGLGRLLRERETDLARYRLVALFDDDIGVDAAGIARLFEAAAAGDFRICQPAVTHDSHSSYALVFRQASLRLRHVNFVETMCPVFRSDVLLEALPLFEAGLEVGIDLVWCHLGNPTPTDFAIIDEVAIRHGRAIGLRKRENGFAGERRYEDDIAEARRRYGIPKLPALAFSAVRRDGRTIGARPRLLLAALGILNAVPRQRWRRERFKTVLILWARTLLVRPRFHPLPVPFRPAGTERGAAPPEAAGREGP